MTKKINFAKMGLVAIALTAMILPSFAQAATFAFVNQSGNISSVEASTPMLAIATATNIDPHSGVILLSSLGGTGGDNTGTGNTGTSVITNLSVSANSNSATLSWNTTENTAAIIYYSTSPITMKEATAGGAVTISGNTFLVHTDLRTSHSGTITGLQSNTTYNYVVYVRSGTGHETITWPSTFRTN